MKKNMSELNQQFEDIHTLVEKYKLRLEDDGNGMMEIYTQHGMQIVFDIETLDQLHSVLLGYDEGYQAALRGE